MSSLAIPVTISLNAIVAPEAPKEVIVTEGDTESNWSTIGAAEDGSTATSEKSLAQFRKMRVATVAENELGTT